MSIDPDEQGLERHVAKLVGRRRALQLLGVGGVAALVGCGSDDDDGGSSTTNAADGGTTTTAASTDSTTTSSATCASLPEETAGPFPGDGSNGPNVLSESGVVRQDIRSSFGSSTTTAEGVPLTVELAVLDLQNGCAPRPGAAVYIWHCDREGRYSMYSQGATDENYLRGVQVADADGKLAFTSIFPAAYQGRWPHIHFEVYSSVDAATAAGSKLLTSQIALPEDACDAAFQTSGYEQSVQNMVRTPLDSDMVFADGYSQQLGQVTGSAADGFTVSLTIPV